MEEFVTLALVRIGTVHLALPAELVECVVKGPVQLAPFPHAPWHVLGAFNLQGLPVPMIDIATLIQPAAAPALARPVAYALVIRHAGGTFGLQVDEIGEIARVAREAVSTLELRSAQGAGLFSQLYTPPEGGRPAVLLDLDALLALDGICSAVASTREARSDAGVRRETRPHVLFRAGGACLAFPASAVRRVERRAANLDSALGHPQLEGFHSFNGIDLPVVDLAALLGLVGGATGGARHVVVAEHEGVAVALTVGEIIGIEGFASEDFQPLADGGLAEVNRYAGSVVNRSGEVTLVLAPEAFWEDASVVDQRALFAKEAAAVESAAVDAEAEILTQFMVYRVGGFTLATPAAELDSVMNLPADFVDLRAPGRELVGLCHRQGKAVKVVDLGALLGQPGERAGPGRPVLVVKSAGGLQGYLVERVQFMQSAVARRLPAPDRREHGSVPAFTHMVRMRHGGRDLAACVLPLAELAAELSEPLATVSA